MTAKFSEYTSTASKALPPAETAKRHEAQPLIHPKNCNVSTVFVAVMTESLPTPSYYSLCPVLKDDGYGTSGCTELTKKPNHEIIKSTKKRD